MKAFLRKHRRTWMLMASGLLTGLCVVWPKLGFLQWLSLVPAAMELFGIAEDRSLKLRKAYGAGLLFFMSYYVVSYHWFFYMYPLEFTGIGKGGALAVVLVADLGLSLLQALGGGFVFLTVAWLYRLRMPQRLRLLIPFLAAADWAVFEWSQTFGWWGVPWGRMPLGQMENITFVRSSALFGSYFVTFILVAVNFACAYIIFRQDAKRLLLTAAAGLFALNAVLGLAVTWTYREEERTVRVAALQGNISSSDKWSSNSLRQTKSIYEELAIKASLEGATLVLLPETAFPYKLLENEGLSSYASTLAAEQELTVLVSAFTRAEEGGNLNSLIQVKPDGTFGEEIYSKQRPVPFGEFVPMREVIMFLIPPLAEIGMLDSDLVPGEESVVLQTREGSIGVCICFDSIYEGYAREAVLGGAELLAVSTNDSWFADSAALAMHNSQSRLRAIETGRYVLRSANTGISSVIDPLGNVKESLGADETGCIVADVELRQSMTLYTYLGNLFVYLCLAALLCYAIIFCIFCRKNNIKIVTK